MIFLDVFKIRHPDGGIDYFAATSKHLLKWQYFEYVTELSEKEWSELDISKIPDRMLPEKYLMFQDEKFDLDPFEINLYELLSGSINPNLIHTTKIKR